MAAALVVAIVLLIVTLVQRADAIHETHLAQSQLVATQALDATDPEVASLLALGAYALSPTIDARRAMLAAVNTHEIGPPVTGHTDGVETVAFTPDGRTLASAGLDHTVRLWNVVTHRELGAPFTGDSDTAGSVAFSTASRSPR